MKLQYFKNDYLKIQMYNSKNIFNLLNLEKSINLALQLSCNLQELWNLGYLETKKAVQHMVFLEGILFDYENDYYRTQQINSLFGIISSLSNNFNKNKNGITPKNKELSRLVLKVGIEPTHPKVLDFESSASTNSAT